MTLLRRTVVKALAATPFALGQTVGQPVGHGLTVGDAVPISMLNQAEAGPDTAPKALDSIDWYEPALAWLKTNPDYLAALRSSIAEETRVTHIDADLVAMRSLSTAARIYYQRQRIIDAQLTYFLDDCPKTRSYNIKGQWLQMARKVLGI